MTTRYARKIELIKSLAANYQMVRAKPALNLFLLQYLKKFKVLNVAGNLVLHSHLPPINSKAYSRFVKEHLLARTVGPSHAQIGLTNACLQNCTYCYNKYRQGKNMDAETIIALIHDLKRMGVFWLGFTGGEPLLNKDIVRIIEQVGDDCSVKLFTTGCNLSRQLAVDLKNAGLFYVSISLDHWKAEEHDRVRRYQGAFQTALKAIDILKNVGELHISVSAVLSKKMIKLGQVEQFLEFLRDLDVHEAWLSETKPSIDAFCKDELVITEQERKHLCRLQDTYNKEGKITVNYLGHFEGKEHFGCNAGHKMIYVDSFGEVSPCVFTPMTFGNIKEASIEKIFQEMRQYFPSGDTCFINKNYKLLQKYTSQYGPICYENSIKLMQEVSFGSLSKFFNSYYH